MRRTTAAVTVAAILAIALPTTPAVGAEAQPVERCDDLAVWISAADDSTPPNYSLGVYTASSSSGALQPISARLGLPDGTSFGEPAWSADGSEIAIGSSGDAVVRVVDATGGLVSELDLSGLDGFAGSGIAADWSPSGEHMSLFSTSIGTGPLYILDLDSLAATRIGSRAYSPELFPKRVAWSPDGSEIAWSGSVNGSAAEQGIFVSRPDGSDVRVISGAGYGTPAWSPDGTTLAWQEQFSRFNWPRIVTGDSRASAGAVVPSTEAFAASEQPVWSPDGAKLAWASIDGDDEMIVVLDLATGSTSVVASWPYPGYTGLHTDPSWSPDGQRLAWTGFAPDGQGLYIWSARTGETTRVLDDRIGTIYGVDWRTTPFRDIAHSSFAWDDIACLYHLGVTTGTGANAYDPSGGVTREQMAAFIARTWRALGQDCPAGPMPFADVAASSFAYDDIVCLAALGITTGTSATTFDPSAGVTREQMAAFIARTWRRAG